MSDMSPLVSIIVLNYNGKDFLLECLSSVTKTDYPNFEVLVVDNGSTDGSIAVAKRQFKNFNFIEIGKNLGYAAGNNVGIKHAKGDYIVLLNNDTIVYDSWLTNLVKWSEKLGDVILQPKIMLMSDHSLLNTVGNRIHILGFGLLTGTGEVDLGQYDKVHEIGYASGTCLFASKKIFDKVGLLDNAHFLQSEDLDWGWRAKIMGIRSYFIPDSKIYHWWSRSIKWSPAKFYWLERNRLFTLLKNYERRTLIIMLPLILFTEAATLIFALMKGFFRSKLKSYVELFMLRKHIRRCRAEISKKRTLPDVYIMHNFELKLEHIYLPKATSILDHIVRIYCKLLFNQIYSLHAPSQRVYSRSDVYVQEG